MKKLYTTGDIYVPEQDNMFWKAFKIGISEAGHTSRVKYEVHCYTKRDVGFEDRVIVMDQESMVPMMRPPTEQELKELNL